MKLVIDDTKLMAKWDPSKNAELGFDPTKLTLGSSKKAWSNCDKGHVYDANISNVVRGAKCRYCTNQAVLVGYNDLATTHPHLADEWHPTRNHNVTPADIITAKKVWWLGKCGHE